MGRLSSTAPATRRTRFIASARPTPKPLLASEVLRDEVAPHEPARSAARFWILAIAATFALLGAAFQFGAGLPAARADAAHISYSAAGALAVVAVLPFPYAARAGLGLLIGLALIALGLRASGPLAGLTLDGSLERDVYRLAVCSVLPAALLLRGYYRQYRPATMLLSLAVLASLPYAVLEARLALDQGAPSAIRAAAGVNAAVIGASALAYAPQITSGITSALALITAAMLPVVIALRQLSFLSGPEAGLFGYPIAAAASSGASLLVAIGVFQLLSMFIAPAARRLARVSSMQTDEEDLEQRNSVG